MNVLFIKAAAKSLSQRIPMLSTMSQKLMQLHGDVPDLERPDTLRAFRAATQAGAPDPMESQLRALHSKHWDSYRATGLPIHLQRGQQVEDTMRRRARGFEAGTGGRKITTAGELTHQKQELGPGSLQDRLDRPRDLKTDRKLTGDSLQGDSTYKGPTHLVS